MIKAEVSAGTDNKLPKSIIIIYTFSDVLLIFLRQVQEKILKNK